MPNGKPVSEVSLRKNQEARGIFALRLVASCEIAMFVVSPTPNSPLFRVVFLKNLVFHPTYLRF